MYICMYVVRQLRVKKRVQLHFTAPYSFIDLAGTNSPSLDNLLLIDFFEVCVSPVVGFGALSVFSADEELSAAKVFAKICRDAVCTTKAVSRSGTVAITASVQCLAVSAKC